MDNAITLESPCGDLKGELGVLYNAGAACCVTLKVGESQKDGDGQRLTSRTGVAYCLLRHMEGNGESLWFFRDAVLP